MWASSLSCSAMLPPRLKKYRSRPDADEYGGQPEHEAQSGVERSPLPDNQYRARAPVAPPTPTKIHMSGWRAV
jgi:hypothetical protein